MGGIAVGVVGSSASFSGEVGLGRKGVCRRALMSCDEALALYQPQLQSQQPSPPHTHPHHMGEGQRQREVDVGWLQAFITTIE